MPLFFYKYLPRFTTGLCQVTTDKWGLVHYKLLTGDIHPTTHPDSVIAEVSYLNVFGAVTFPTILRTYEL